ncbi:DUF5665 domain-containing protein [Fonticella tunisiensis]|uniref:Uncharacterized protein n=1 Tax=Fonticella tunisiensis TaxID=1096341 RepID=A0A4R7KR42_9CLOT|nr:DUF5665 domain-containing protein [Fonticella tunisiensis]TDT61831.1 hypothetical protein EDD71_1059 [Fonticella tunisiensis]
MASDCEEYRKVLQTVAAQLERAKFGDYIDLMQNPVRMIALNFISGIARGFGIAVGFTILGALVLYLLQRLVVLNLPIIGGIITEIVKLVQLNTKIR